MSQITEEYRIALANYARESLFEQLYCSHLSLLKNFGVNEYIELLDRKFFEKTGLKLSGKIYDKIFKSFSGLCSTYESDLLWHEIDALFLKFDKKNRIIQKKSQTKKIQSSIQKIQDSIIQKTESNAEFCRLKEDLIRFEILLKYDAKIQRFELQIKGNLFIFKNLGLNRLYDEKFQLLATLSTMLLPESHISILDSYFKLFNSLLVVDLETIKKLKELLR